jgi:hypothetical protein
VDETAEAQDDATPGGRLVALPRRSADADSLSGSPTAAVFDLLDRTNHLLNQLELDIDSLKRDQEKDRRRIHAEAEQFQQAADAAIERLKALAFKARTIAEHKARTDVLDAALARKIPLDTSVSFDELVRRIEEEIRLAKGITGAIRLQTIGDLLKQATLRVELMTSQAEKSRARLLKETEQELHSEGKEARASYEIGMSVVRRDLKALDLALPPSGLGWDDHRWEHWEGWDPLSGASRWVRFGTYYRPQLEKFRYPALLEMPGERGFAIDVAAGARDVAVDGMRSIILRVLASIPAGDARFTFIDPTGLGESIAPFLPLGEYRSDLVDEQVYTAEGEIETKLLEVTKHIERIIQDHLRGDYETIEQHREATGELVEPYRFLCVFDFPTQLSDRSRELLRNIIDNGPRCGVYTLMTTAPGAARANGARWKAMLAGLDVIVGDAKGYWFDHDLSGRWTVAFDPPPDLTVSDANGELTLFGRILTKTGEAAKEGRSVDVSQARVFELMAEAVRLKARDDVPDLTTMLDPDDPATWWTGSSQRGIGVPIGRAGLREATSLWLDSGARSGALVGGERGSGKSMVLHGAILGLALTYAPSELTMYLLDLNPGSSGFEAYATEALPHARVVGIDTDREFAVSVIDGLVREMTRRAMLFAPHGGERVGIEGYRRESGDELPRILLVIDGLDRLFAVSDREGDRAAQLLDTLLRQGPSYGIHLLAATHTMSDIDRIGRHTFDQLRVRIALACSDEESRLLLGEHSPQASLLGRAGEALLNLADGDPAQAQHFQSTSIDDHERGLALRDLRRLAMARQLTRTPQVFEGRAPARLEDSAIRHLGEHASMQHARLKPRLWLGEPCAIGNAVEVTMRREAGSNLLIVGRDERQGQGLLVAAMASAVLGHGDGIDVRVLDFMPLESGFGEATRVLATRAPVQLFRRRSLEDALTGVLVEVEKRAAKLDFTNHPVLFMINGLGPGAGLVADAPADGFDPVRTLERVVREGPEVGVHTIIWSDRLPTIAAQTSRATLRAFAQRVAMHMPAEDSAMLIDSATASSLNDNQALLYDEATARLTKFRPYLIPPLDFVESLARAATRVPAAAST